MIYKHKLYKAIGLIALCMVIYAPVIAQDESTIPIRFGAKVGIGSSNLAVDYFQPLGQARTTISIGGFAQYRFFNWLGVNLDLMYAQTGGANVNPRLFYFKGNPMLGIPELNKSLERTDLLMHRIEIPITANISIPNFEGNIKPILILGPSFGYTVKAKAINSYKWDFEAAPNDLITVTQDDLKDKIQSLDVGGVFGFGVDFDAKPVSYTLGITYRMSFTETNNYKYSLFPNYTFNTAQVFFAVKFGRGHKNPAPLVTAPPAMGVVVPEPEVKFSVYSPTNIPTVRRVRETFPIRNSVFFDLGSTEIPDRYVLITKDQVKDFRTDRLEVFTPKHLSGRSQRQMTAYYNVLNILGDRMGRFPSTIVRLSGASMEGIEDGLAMAESVKRYLVSVFGIDASRINTEGQLKPRIPSEQPGGTKDLDLLREGDHRVSIWSESPEILMEYQTGPDAPLAPVEIITVQEAPIDSYVSFNVEGAKEAFSSWSLEVRDNKRVIQKFGPYTQEKISLPGKSILGTRPEGDYRVTMVGHTKSGKTVRNEISVHMVLWTPSEREEGMRYSVLFEFNESQAITIYEKYLTDIVTPKIPKGGTVIIHGHTDITGDEAHNMELSLARANDVRGIIESALSKAGRSDVKFEVYGFGEDENLSPFENKFPEERFYNRTVIIDIIPAK